MVATLIRNCGFCPACSEGAPVFCEEVFPLDRETPLHDDAGKPIVHGLRTGAFAEHIVVDQSQAVAIPKDIPLDSAALISCGVLTGLGAVLTRRRESRLQRRHHWLRRRRPQFHPGRAALRRLPIIAVDVEPSKLAAAREFGATETINARSENVVERAAALNGGRKADWVFVTVGVKGAAEQGVSLMKRNGATVLVGMPASGVMATIDPGWLAADGQRIPAPNGLGAADDRCAEDRPALSRGSPQDRPIDQRPLPAQSINEALASSRSGAAVRNVIVF